MTGHEVLLDGLSFGEAPRWRGGALYVSDLFDEVVLRLDPGAQRPEVVARVAGRPCGMDWDTAGRHLVAEMQTRRVLEVGADQATWVHADLSASCAGRVNELLADEHGGCWVNATGFDLEAFARRHGAQAAFGPDGPPDGNIMHISADGTARVVADGLRLPNGMGRLPDGALLVAETLAARVTAFTPRADGGLGDRRTWTTLPGTAPDGIAVSRDGVVWVADALSPTLIALDDAGRVVERIAVGAEPAYAVAVDEDGALGVVVGGQALDPTAALAQRAARILRVTLNGERS